MATLSARSAMSPVDADECRSIAADLSDNPEARAMLERYAAELEIQARIRIWQTERRPPLIG